MNRKIKSIVSICSSSGGTPKAMKHHVMGYLEDESPDTLLLHHVTIDPRSQELAEKIVNDIINVALSAKNKKNTVYVSGLTVKNDKYDRKGKEIS